MKSREEIDQLEAVLVLAERREKNASFLTCWGATQRLPGSNSGREPALLPSTLFVVV